MPTVLRTMLNGAFVVAGRGKNQPEIPTDGQLLLRYLYNKMEKRNLKIKQKVGQAPDLNPGGNPVHANSEFKALRGLKPLSENHATRPILFLPCSL